MLVEAEADKYVDLIALPLILCEETVYRCLLLKTTSRCVIYVIEVVVVVLRTYGKLRWQACLVV